MKRYCCDSSEYERSHRIKKKRCLDPRTFYQFKDLFKSVNKMSHADMG